MRHTKTAAALLGAALLWQDPGALAAQGQVVRLPERDRPLSGEAPVAFTIGRAEGADHEMFAEVSAVGFDAQDNLYVLDRQNTRVMVYDRGGRFLRQIGKPGQGPGELSVPVAMAVAPDGTVAVVDLGNMNFSYFRPDGTFLRSHRLDGWMPMFSAPVAWHPRGGVVGTFRARTGEMGAPAGEQVTPLLFQPAADGAMHRIFGIPQTFTTQQSSSAPGQVQVRMMPPPAFSPRINFGVLPDGNVAMSFTTGYTVRVVAMDGTTLRYIQRPMPVRLTTEADRARAREQRRETMQSGRGTITISRGGGGGAAPPRGADRQSVERSLGEMRFADTIPAIDNLRVAPSGTIWVERTSATIYDPGPIDLITPAGEYRGTVTAIALPAAISRGGLAAFVDRDELDVARVTVRRLPEGWR